MNVQNWTHNYGYRLNADGKAIEYQHENKPLVAYIEACVDPQNGMEYRPSIIDDTTDKFVTYPPCFADKDAALSFLESEMQQH